MKAKYIKYCMNQNSESFGNVNEFTLFSDRIYNKNILQKKVIKNQINNLHDFCTEKFAMTDL